ncbi:protein TIC 20-IV, chloroplastic-like [Eucalyptus grandis]|uniref:protein TIC 20-IV, chloroplastic-like n=1 Tax=Eucalyptus grandis TaxID=71139 RepID=UPI0005242FE4|nr:protein TIC 20-IV, chloroplastic-like [Eucalyptus grandis]
MALQISDTAFYFQPLMEHYEQVELLSYYIPGAIHHVVYEQLRAADPLRGQFGMYYWAMVGSAFIVLLMDCVRCTVVGIYASIPFIRDATYIRTPYVKGDD